MAHSGNTTPPDSPATRDDRYAFPLLSDDEIERIRPFGTVETLEPGELLFERGERSVDFFVVLSGRVEIFHSEPSDDRVPTSVPDVVHMHHERGFTGELDLFSDRKILVSGRIMPHDDNPEENQDENQTELPSVIRVPRQQFSKLLTAEPEIGNTIIRAFILRRIGLVDHAQGAVTLIGKPKAPGLLEIERFLRRNAHPVRVLRADKVEPADLPASVLREGILAETDLPMAICPGGTVLRRPTRAELAECLGFTEQPDENQIYDVTVVGAGPSGLAAAVYAASEGLKTLVVESEAPGGQAGSSSRIENYLGFPTGLSGQELSGRAQVQAQKFGARLTVPRRVVRLESCGHGKGGYAVHLDEGPPVRTRAVVLACGAAWRRLDIPAAKQFENRGIHFAATSVEADLCGDSEVIVVGGGNSAGQAAVFLSRHASRVHMLIRGESPAASMSDYLLQRIQASDRISLSTGSAVTAVRGEDWLEEVDWTSGAGETITRPIGHAFLMIGASANTGWLKDAVQLDRNGFICTGGAIKQDDADLPWSIHRPPHPLETSLPGVFAAGDVRAGSVKRVASAVGEGSVCIQDVHRVLEEQRA